MNHSTTEVIRELVIQWQVFCNDVPPKVQTIHNFFIWLEAQDINTNPHRYPNNPDLPEEIDDNRPES